MLKYYEEEKKYRGGGVETCHKCGGDFERGAIEPCVLVNKLSGEKEYVFICLECIDEV